MIPKQVQDKAKRLAEAYEKKEIKARTTEAQKFKVLNLGPKWRMVDRGKGKGWEIYNHNDYDNLLKG